MRITETKTTTIGSTTEVKRDHKRTIENAYRTAFEQSILVAKNWKNELSGITAWDQVIIQFRWSTRWTWIIKYEMFRRYRHRVWISEMTQWFVLLKNVNYILKHCWVPNDSKQWMIDSYEKPYSNGQILILIKKWAKNRCCERDAHVSNYTCVCVLERRVNVRTESV